MAERDFTAFHAFTGNVDATQRYPKEDSASGCWIVQWTGLLNGDTGKPYYAPDYPDKSIQVSGTDGTGGEVTVQVSNEEVPTNWATARDQNATNIVVQAGVLYAVVPNSHAVRPNVTNGDGSTNYTVTMLISTVARR